MTLSGTQPDTKYWLTLPQGASYNAVAGKLRLPRSVQFASVLPFTTPFRQPDGLSARDIWQAAYQGANSRRLELFMPHGLDIAATAGAGIEQRIRLTDNGIPFESFQKVKNITGVQQPVVLDINATVTSAYASCLAFIVVVPSLLLSLVMCDRL